MLGFVLSYAYEIIFFFFHPVSENVFVMFSASRFHTLFYSGNQICVQLNST